MITRRIKALMNVRLATRIESVILVKDQIEDVRFESQHEIDKFLELNIFAVADGKIKGLPVTAFTAPPTIERVEVKAAADVPITETSTSNTASDADVHAVISEDIEVENDAEEDAEPEEDVKEDADVEEDNSLKAEINRRSRRVTLRK